MGGGRPWRRQPEQFLGKDSETQPGETKRQLTAEAGQAIWTSVCLFTRPSRGLGRGPWVNRLPDLTPERSPVCLCDCSSFPSSRHLGRPFVLVSSYFPGSAVSHTCPTLPTPIGSGLSTQTPFRFLTTFSSNRHRHPWLTRPTCLKSGIAFSRQACNCRTMLPRTRGLQ